MTYGRSTLRVGALILGALLLSGCALSRTTSAASTSQQLTATAPRKVSLGMTVESTQPALAAALAHEAAAPSAQSHMRVADEYRRLGIFDAAHTRLKLALKKAPRLALAHEHMARLWRDWGLPHEALGAAYRAVRFDRGSARTLNTLGTVFDALGQLQAARDAYQRALLRDPTASWAANNLCYVELRLGHPDDARVFCHAALRLEPDFVAARNNLALTYAAAGDFSRAREEFVAAGDPATAAYNVGMLHLAAGRYVPAAQAFEEAIQARPDFVAAKARAHAARLRALSGSH